MKPAKYIGPAIVVAESVAGVSSQALLDQIKKRVPNIQFPAPPPPDFPGCRPTAIGCYGEILQGRICGVSLIDNLAPIGEASFVRSAWWWPDNRQALARGKAHAVTIMSAGADPLPAKERVMLEMQLVAAALDLLPSAIAVIWPDADAMWKPDGFKSALDRSNGAVPLQTAISVKLGVDSENLDANGKPKWFARTHGLHAFDHMELEWRAFGGTPLELATHLLTISSYVLSADRQINSGDSVGYDEPGGGNGLPPLILRHEQSTTGFGDLVCAIYPQRTQ